VASSTRVGKRMKITGIAQIMKAQYFDRKSQLEKLNWPNQIWAHPVNFRWSPRAELEEGKIDRAGALARCAALGGEVKGEFPDGTYSCAKVAEIAAVRDDCALVQYWAPACCSGDGAPVCDIERVGIMCDGKALCTAQPA
jgi:hypothetical protein